jgi:hypothetical protein
VVKIETLACEVLNDYYNSSFNLQSLLAALKTRSQNPHFIRVQSVADLNFRFSFSLFHFAFTLTA